MSELGSGVENNIESLLGKNYKLVNNKKINKLLHKLEPLFTIIEAFAERLRDYGTGVACGRYVEAISLKTMKRV